MAEQFPWDVYFKALMELGDHWGRPHRHENLKQKAADFFFVRSNRRSIALQCLFCAGLYSEAIAIVRCGFEEWLTYAWAVAGWDEGRWDAVNDTVGQTDARVYEGFVGLWGQAEADSHFAGMPEHVRRWLGVKGGLPDLASRARSVGLDGVYRVAYPYLSAYSHPTMRPFVDLFDEGAQVVRARVPRRDADEEAVPALWALWFETRVLTLANGAYGIDVEDASDALLTLLEDGPDFRTAVLVREQL